MHFNDAIIATSSRKMLFLLFCYIFRCTCVVQVYIFRKICCTRYTRYNYSLTWDIFLLDKIRFIGTLMLESVFNVTFYAQMCDVCCYMCVYCRGHAYISRLLTCCLLKHVIRRHCKTIVGYLRI